MSAADNEITKMLSLADYVMDHTDRGECQCGQCIDKGDKPDPVGHTVDVQFFKVAVVNDPTPEDLIKVAKEQKGEFGDCDPLDGKEHGYIELGGWLGSQDLALRFMALGTSLGVFTLFTPKMLKGLPTDLQQMMAGRGMVTVTAVEKT